MLQDTFYGSVILLLSNRHYIVTVVVIQMHIFLLNIYIKNLVLLIHNTHIGIVYVIVLFLLKSGYDNSFSRNQDCLDYNNCYNIIHNKSVFTHQSEVQNKGSRIPLCYIQIIIIIIGLIKYFLSNKILTSPIVTLDTN